MANVELMNDYSGFERSGGNTGMRLAAQVERLSQSGAFQETDEPLNWSEYYNTREYQLKPGSTLLPETGDFGLEARGEGSLRLLANYRHVPAVTQGVYDQAPAADK